MREWLFEPLDTLFFRDGLSIDAGETGYVESIFPPHPQTMQGVVRSAVLLSHCKDPKTFGSGKCDTCGAKKCLLPDAIGSPKEGDYRNLDLFGPYLIVKKENDKYERYYTAPLDLMREKEGGKRLFSLRPSDKPVACDLGDVRLPAKPQKSDYKAPDVAGGWIREDALKQYLQKGTIPVRGKLLAENEFYEKEPKVGIEREYDTHKVKTGNLYSIVPLRFKKDIEIGLRVGGIDKTLEPKGFASKIGGEGRVCKLEIKDYDKPPDKFQLKEGNRIKLLLLQPADFNSSWLPNNFNKTTCNGTTCWEGSIDGISGATFRLISACIGRQQKIGGWDVVKKAVKPMKSYVPAGSVYFLEVINNTVSEIPAEGKIGNNTAIGLGHYILGRW